MPTAQLVNLFILSILWGGSFLFIGVAVQELAPLLLVFLRVAIAAVAMLIVLKLVKVKLPTTIIEWRNYAVMGLINNVIPFTLIFYAQTHISVSLASIINAMTPVCTFIVLALFGEELLKPNKILGSLMGLAGVAILSGLLQLSLDVSLLGVLMSFGATVSYGFSGLWAKRHLAGRNSIQSATCQMISSTGLMLILMPLLGVSLPSALPSNEVIWAVLTLALASTALAYILFFELISKAGTSNAMLVTLLVPVSGSVLGHLVMGDQLHLIQLVGALMIGLGLLIIDGRIFKRKIAN